MVCRRRNIKIQQRALTPAQAWFSSKAAHPSASQPFPSLPLCFSSSWGKDHPLGPASQEGVFQHPQTQVRPKDNKGPLSPCTGQCGWSPCSHRDIQPPLQSWVWPYSSNRELLQSQKLCFYQICGYRTGTPQAFQSL